MNARQPHPLAHVPTGITIRWSRALDALYPESERGPCATVTVDVGLLYGRLVVQLVDGGPWLDMSSLPDRAAADVRFMEREAWLSWCERNGRDADDEWAAAAEPVTATESPAWFDAGRDEIPF